MLSYTPDCIQTIRPRIPRSTTCRSPKTPWRPRSGRATGSPEPSTSTQSPHRPLPIEHKPTSSTSPRRAHRLAHPPARANDLRHRGDRPLPTRGRRHRGHPPRRPCVLRARREPLARRHPKPPHGPHRDPRGRRHRQPRHLGRTRHRQGIPGRSGVIVATRTARDRRSLRTTQACRRKLVTRVFRLRLPARQLLDVLERIPIQPVRTEHALDEPPPLSTLLIAQCRLLGGRSGGQN